MIVRKSRHSIFGSILAACCVAFLVFIGFHQFWYAASWKASEPFGPAKVVVLYSGLYRVFGPSFRGFLNHVVLPNKDIDFDLIFDTQATRFCSTKDLNCAPEKVRVGQCNNCMCLERVTDFEKTINAEIDLIMGEMGVPAHRATVQKVILEEQGHPLRRLQKAWAHIKKNVNLFATTKHVLYLRPDTSPTAQIVFADICPGRGAYSDPSLVLLSGEVNRGQDWPLHNRDYDLGAISCNAYHFDIFISNIDVPCSDRWNGCQQQSSGSGGGNEKNTSKPLFGPPVGHLSNAITCDHEACASMAALATLNTTVTSLDSQGVFARIHRYGEECKLTHQVQ